MGKIYLNGVDYSASNAKANVQSDWNVTDTTSEAYIANKPVSLPANGGNAATVNNHTVNADVPSDAKFTDTTYSAATASKAGLMSSADKTKLDGIEETLGTLANQIDELNTGLKNTQSALSETRTELDTRISPRIYLSWNDMGYIDVIIDDIAVGKITPDK